MEPRSPSDLGRATRAVRGADSKLAEGMLCSIPGASPDLAGRLVRFRPGLLVASLVSGLLAAVFVFSWGYQIRTGIGVAGINRPVFWGFYITNFVFWIGISHAGTLISAILRVTGAEWRRPVTRCAETITVFALAIGGLYPIIHLGRPEKLLFMLPLPNDRGLWPNFRSPLIWDLAAITAYIVGSVLYLYLPLIPDMAILRDRTTGKRRLFYSILALGWRGTPQQWRSLEAGIKVMAIVIIPLAVSVHTIVSWDFAMTQAPMWNSTIFGPYFVVGAIYSGIAMLLIAMTLLRRFLGLETWLSLKVFNNLALLFLAMTMFWGYFTFAEHLTVWYANEPAEAYVFWERAIGAFSKPFWVMIVLNFVIPMLVLPFRWGRTPIATTIVSIGVVIGMWLERFLIVIPTLSLPRLTYTIGQYAPTWVELGIAVGSLGAFLFLYLAFTQLAPIVSIWEIREGRAIEGLPTLAQSSEALSSEALSSPREPAAAVEASADTASADSIVAAFADEEVLAEALEQLQKAAVSGDRIEVRSSIPLQVKVPGAGGRSRVPLIGVLGAALGGGGVYLLATLTSKAYPLYTGHMDIIAAPPIGIVTYEGIALGAVLSTFLAVIFEAGLPRRTRKGALDRHVADGAVVLSVDCPGGDKRPEIEAAVAGAMEVVGA